MASKAEKQYPPYPGEEPYIHLCFSSRDERRVQPLLRRLLLHGCRVWYCVGETRDRAALTSRNRRMLGAGLTVLYLTAAARADTELKNRLLVCQRMGQPILVLNTDGGDSGLSLGLTGEAAAVLMGGSAADACDAILHGRGFSQDFLSPQPFPVYDRLWLKRVNASLVILSLLLAGGVGVYKYLHPPVVTPEEPIEIEATPEPADEVDIPDEELREAVRAAMGGGQITKAGLQGIESLYLARLPEDLQSLSLLPNLTTLRLSSAAAQAAPEHSELYERYTLIVAGGEEP